MLAAFRRRYHPRLCRPGPVELTKFQQTLRLTRQTSTGPESPVGRAARDVVDMADPATERIVMTPLPKRENTSSILIERVAAPAADADGAASSDVHVAGGDHRGIVVNKSRKTDMASLPPAQLTLEFKVFLVSADTSLHTQESRTLRFWFKEYVPEQEQARYAQEFFKELVSPLDFPRDYVGFITKIMKLMQTKYVDLRRVSLELTLLGESVSAPVRPISPEGHANGEVELTEAKVLEIIEQSYPNPVTVQQMAKQTYRAEEEVQLHLAALTERGSVRPLESGGYTRVQENDTAVTVVKQMPTVVSAQQPTIAIITANYCEKLAVDAMIVNKETFVRFTTVGESNVYTLGNIGAHRVVSTKLPTVGHTRGAVIAAGSSTTRLLGCFQGVEYVFLVGVGGGVPHYTDYSKHVRLGDVVVAAPTPGQRFIYLHCERASELDAGAYEFETKSWGPPQLDLQNIAELLRQQGEEHPDAAPWLKYMSDGQQRLLEQDAAFQRPPDDTDKLYMAIGDKDVIEVAHPAPADCTTNLRERGRPMIHLGPVASGRQVVGHEQMRQEFSSQVGILAYDAEFDSVVESIYGNRKDNYIFIRGIADYKDGTRGREWQPYASLAAASFMKAVICAMDPPKGT
ncbi:uncharacterized protein LOC122365404 isoform X3 [Amphibalanus amphitrite]|uniref:uncharacterized protein LOC122365404 isoform X3 n=2 Tax=Amphibalanus amphitrite TaxID=1232801 RepID=UPI001C919285|nr:uncharacterized protein LOC122365404 isoform X3 [Amphibalanus amphitrite]